MTPAAEDLDEVVSALRRWQRSSTPFQLHPGDLGWFWRFGAGATAAAVRTWRDGGRIVAVGLLDGPDLLRLAIAPALHRDEVLARRLLQDLVDPACGVLPEGAVAVEAPPGALVQDLLGEAGWPLDEPWSLLRRDLAAPVEPSRLRLEVVGAERAAVWVALQQIAFGGSMDDTAVQRWHDMAAGSPFADARCLVGHDPDVGGDAVAAVTVWSAGRGRCGVIEPLGVHPDARGRGHGRAITLAAAATLADLGSCCALVATPSANVGAVATYVSAGFERLTDRFDRRRDDTR